MLVNALGGIGSVLSAIGIWLAVFAIRTEFPFGKVGDDMLGTIKLIFLQARLTELVLAALLLVAGSIFLVGAAVIWQMQRSRPTD